MIAATDLKIGVSFEYEGKPCKVVKYNHIKIGRGGASVRVSIRNLESGDLSEKTFQSTTKFEEISTLKRALQYLYKDDVNASFMDPTSFEQVEVPLSVLGDDIKYVKEGEDANVLFWGERALSVEIPPKVTLDVVETDAGIKGNSATNVYKPAILTGGVEVKVPLFIKVGDKIRVDTRDGSYVERA